MVFIENLLNSFKLGKSGFSFRKLTAIVIIICVILIHIKWFLYGDIKQVDMLLAIDYGFIATLLGLTTISDHLNNKKEKIDTEEELNK